MNFPLHDPLPLMLKINKDSPVNKGTPMCQIIALLQADGGGRELPGRPAQFNPTNFSLHAAQIKKVGRGVLLSACWLFCVVNLDDCPLGILLNPHTEVQRSHLFLI